MTCPKKQTGIQLCENNPKECLETCEDLIVEYFHKKLEFVAAWRNYGKNVIVTMPTVVEAEVDVIIKSTEGKMNIVLNKIKDYVFLEDVWKAPINGKTVMNFFFVILGLVDGALKPEHKDELPKRC